MVSHLPEPVQPNQQPPRIVNEYKRFLREPDLLLKLPAAEQMDDSAKTREFAIQVDDDEEASSQA